LINELEWTEKIFQLEINFSIILAIFTEKKFLLFGDKFDYFPFLDNFEEA